MPEDAGGQKFSCQDNSGYKAKILLKYKEKDGSNEWKNTGYPVFATTQDRF